QHEPRCGTDGVSHPSASARRARDALAARVREFGIGNLEFGMRTLGASRLAYACCISRLAYACCISRLAYGCCISRLAYGCCTSRLAYGCWISRLAYGCWISRAST